MKDIISKINESWEYTTDIRSNLGGEELNVPKDAKWLLVNPESEYIAAITEKDLKSFTTDFEDGTVEKECKKLRVGGIFDSDGGINIYIRIKK